MCEDQQNIGSINLKQTWRSRQKLYSLKTHLELFMAQKHLNSEKLYVCQMELKILQQRYKDHLLTFLWWGNKPQWMAAVRSHASTGNWLVASCSVVAPPTRPTQTQWVLLYTQKTQVKNSLKRYCFTLKCVVLHYNRLKNETLGTFCFLVQTMRSIRFSSQCASMKLQSGAG